MTGAGGRIGRALALRLAVTGHDVAVHFNGSREGAEETARLIRADGRHAAPLGADLLDPAAASALVPEAAGALGGPLSALVNSASIFDRDTLADATPEGFARHMGLHALAPLLLTQAFAAQARPGALVVNLLDAGLDAPAPDFFTYTLSKDALRRLTLESARALAPRVRVVAISPGPTLPAPRQRPEHFEALRRATPLGAGSDPGDLADALGWLLGAKAVTGVVVPVDGGLHLGPRP